jgi:hypothetical protein
MNRRMALSISFLLSSALAASSFGCSSVADKESNVGAVSQALNTPKDINGDGQTDFVWQGYGGIVQAWFMSGTDIPPGGGVNFRDVGGTTDLIVSSPWLIRGEGDFNGDGSNDFVFQNTSTGEIQYWFMSTSDGTRRVGAVSVYDIPTASTIYGATWPLEGVSDLNGDGVPDLIFHDAASTGQYQVWFMGGLGGLGRVSYDYLVDSGVRISRNGFWRLGAIGKVSGSPNLYLQNVSTGDLELWHMSGISRTATFGITSNGAPMAIGAPYYLTGMGKIDTGSTDDLIFYNTTTGKTLVRFMANATDSNGSKNLQLNGVDYQIFWTLMPD